MSDVVNRVVAVLAGRYIDIEPAREVMRNDSVTVHYGGRDYKCPPIVEPGTIVGARLFNNGTAMLEFK